MDNQPSSPPPQKKRGERDPPTQTRKKLFLFLPKTVILLSSCIKTFSCSQNVCGFSLIVQVISLRHLSRILVNNFSCGMIQITKSHEETRQAIPSSKIPGQEEY